MRSCVAAAFVVGMCAILETAAAPSQAVGAQPTVLAADGVPASSVADLSFVYRTTPSGEATDDLKAPKLHHFEGATWMSAGDPAADATVRFTPPPRNPHPRHDYSPPRRHCYRHCHHRHHHRHPRLFEMHAHQLRNAVRPPASSSGSGGFAGGGVTSSPK